MKSYYEVTDFIGEKITQKTLTEQINFVQQLIYQFAKDLPNDWLDNELEQEKPHYQAIFAQITNPNFANWQADIIEQHLADLDAIMWDMGDDYPHSTSDVILTLIDLLDAWLVLRDSEQKNDEGDEVIIRAVINYLDIYDAEVFETTGDVADNDTWLDYPQIAKAFENVKSALVKNS